LGAVAVHLVEAALGEAIVDLWVEPAGGVIAHVSPRGAEFDDDGVVEVHIAWWYDCIIGIACDVQLGIGIRRE
jgi:hypothetical protein